MYTVSDNTGTASEYYELYDTSNKDLGNSVMRLSQYLSDDPGDWWYANKMYLSMTWNQITKIDTGKNYGYISFSSLGLAAGYDVHNQCFFIKDTTTNGVTDTKRFDNGDYDTVNESKNLQDISTVPTVINYDSTVNKTGYDKILYYDYPSVGNATTWNEIAFELDTTGIRIYFNGAVVLSGTWAEFGITFSKQHNIFVRMNNTRLRCNQVRTIKDSKSNYSKYDDQVIHQQNGPHSTIGWDGKIYNVTPSIENRYSHIERMILPIFNNMDSSGTVAYNHATQTKIDIAKVALSGLSSNDQSFVINNDWNDKLNIASAKYTAAELNAALAGDLSNISAAKIQEYQATYNSLKAYVDSGIIGPPTAYNAQSLVTNYSRLQNAIAQSEVIALIDAIPSPITYNDTTKKAIDDARKAYNALSDSQKNGITNYPDLQKAEASYAIGDAVSSTVKVRSTAMQISDTLAINYKIAKVSGYTYKMKFSLNGETVTVSSYTTDSSGRYVFLFDEISPNLIGETITSVIIVSDQNGNSVELKPAEYSVTKYINNTIASTSNDIKTLFAAMVNYGDKAVDYVNSISSGADMALPSTDITSWGTYSGLIGNLSRNYVSVEAQTKLNNATVGWGESNLVLAENIKIKFTLTGTVKSGYKAIVTYNGDNYTNNIVNENGTYYFVFENYNAAQMSRPFHIVIVDASGNAVSNTLTFSIESYAESMLKNNPAGTKLGNLLTAMMQYGDAAFAYKKS